MLKKILFIIGILLLALFGIVTCQPAEYSISRSTVVNGSKSSIFPLINSLKKQKTWSPWAKKDPNMVSTYSGPEEGVGQAGHWEGNSEVGSGDMKITESVRDSKVKMAVTFIKPGPWQSEALLALEDADAGNTRVTWTMSGENNFMGKMMSLFTNMDSHIGTDFDAGLADLKTLVESNASKPFATAVNYEAKALSLIGSAPSEADKVWAVDFAEKSLAGYAISSHLDVNEDAAAPSNWKAAVEQGILAAAHLKSGSMSLTEVGKDGVGQWALAGAVDEAYQQVALKTLFDGKDYMSTFDVSVAAPQLSADEATCQGHFNELLAANHIKFKSGSAKIDSSSIALIKKLAKVTRSCPGAHIEISGHTDADGDEAMNLKLSRSRAGAVKAALAKSGVKVGGLEATGFGETRPLASNDTPEGKAQNRRIEFHIRH